MNNWDPPRIVVDAHRVAKPNGRSGGDRPWRPAGVPVWVWVTTGVVAMIGVGTIAAGGDQPEVARIVSISSSTVVAQSPLPAAATTVASTAPPATTAAPDTTAPPTTAPPSTVAATTTATTTTPPTTAPPTTTATTTTAPPSTTTSPPPAPTVAVQPVLPQERCDPNYSGCVPIDTDVDCAGGSGNGPSYVDGPVTVIGDDIYGLDHDNDGIGCE